MALAIPQEVLDLQQAQVVPASSILTTTISQNYTGKYTALNLYNNKTHNQLNVIGVRVRINNAADTRVNVEDGTLLLTPAMAAGASLTISTGNMKILENFPIEALNVEGTSRVYVPVWWENFNPATSQILIQGLPTFTNNRSLEITLIHSRILGTM